MKLSTLIISMLAGAIAYGQNPLFIPDTLSGSNINLTIQNGTHQFFTGQVTNTYGVNGNILAPTLLLNQGDSVYFTVNNQIGDTTTMHWHGLHVSPENDGGPHSIIPPNTSWSPKFGVLDKAATYWYHPHLHGITDEHVSKGLAGFILVRDAEEQALALPRTYGIDDFPLALQTKAFDTNYQILSHTNSDSIMMVNATVDPMLDVPAQMVRFRVLNGSSQRAFYIGLTGNQPFQQIASDGGLLAAPVTLTRLLLTPGERAEIVIDFSSLNGQSIDLISYASEFLNGIYGSAAPGMNASMPLTGYNPNPLNGADFTILQYNVGAPTTNAITTLPSTLAAVVPIDENTADKTRTFTFTPMSPGFNQLNGHFLINGNSFDHMVITDTVLLGATEIWEVTNQSAISHPFHVHDVQFYILTRDGVAPPANEAGRKDVVLVKPQETVRFIAKFEDFADENIPYMFHCHLLTHEDNGMMGQFIVIDPPLGLEENLISNKIKLYPNPTKNRLNINAGTENIKSVLIYNLTGELILKTKVNKNKTSLNISNLANGVYLVKINTVNGTKTEKIIIQ